MSTQSITGPGIQTIERGVKRMNFCSGMAPEWADEVRHPDMHSTEYWKRISVIHSEDFNEEVPVGIVQNGPSAVPQISIGGIRFTLLEAHDYHRAVGTALDLAGGADGGASITADPPQASPRCDGRGDSTALREHAGDKPVPEPEPVLSRP